MTRLILSDPDFEEDLAEMKAIMLGKLSVPKYHSIRGLHKALLEDEDDSE